MNPYKMVIAVTNQKGGCAKTTTAVNLASVLAHGGREEEFPPAKVLLVDLDPQGNAATSFGVDKGLLEYTALDALMNESGEGSPLTEEMLIGPKQLAESMRTAWEQEYPEKKCPNHLKVDNLWLLPSNIHLSGTEIELAGRIGRETRLKEGLEPIIDLFDYIIIDTPPSLGLLTINALAAANWAMIPVQAEYYALEGMSQLMNTVRMVRKRINPDLKLFGIVLTMVIQNSKLSGMVCGEVKKHFKDVVFSTVIPRRVEIAEAPATGVPATILHQTMSRRRGSNQYWGFGKEFHDRVITLRKKFGVKETSRLILHKHREMTKRSSDD